MKDSPSNPRKNVVFRLVRAFVGAFRGSSPGASTLEYLSVVAMVALFAIASFYKFGRTLHEAYESEAEHIEGRGLPGQGNLDLLGLVGGLTDPTGQCNLQTGVCAPGSCFCFGKGTLVATESGDRPIETIAPGDKVWSRDPDTGAVALRRVLNTWVNPSARVIDVTLNDAVGGPERIQATPDHPFWVEGRGWVVAGELAGEALWSTDAAVTASADLQSTAFVTTYNLDVEGFHTYFVGRSRALVHNQTATGGNGCSCDGLGPMAGIVPSAIASATGLQCGQSGSYGSLPAPKGRPLQRDHVPSTGALTRRAEMLFFDQPLTPDEEKAIKAKAPKAYNAFKKAVQDAGQAITIPTDVHTSSSETYGGRNKRSKQEQDAANMPGAAQRDVRAIQAELDRKQHPCAAAYRASSQQILNMSQADYDRQISNAYNSLPPELLQELRDAGQEVLGGGEEDDDE